MVDTITLTSYSTSKVLDFWIVKEVVEHTDTGIIDLTIPGEDALDKMLFDIGGRSDTITLKGEFVTGATVDGSANQTLAQQMTYVRDYFVDPATQDDRYQATIAIDTRETNPTGAIASFTTRKASKNKMTFTMVLKIGTVQTVFKFGG